MSERPSPGASDQTLAAWIRSTAVELGARGELSISYYPMAGRIGDWMAMVDVKPRGKRNRWRRANGPNVNAALAKLSLLVAHERNISPSGVKVSGA